MVRNQTHALSASCGAGRFCFGQGLTLGRDGILADAKVEASPLGAESLSGDTFVGVGLNVHSLHVGSIGYLLPVEYPPFGGIAFDCTSGGNIYFPR